MEVQLWADGRGFLSSWTAGRLAGLRRMPGTDIHYTVPPSFRRDQPHGVHLDRSFWFHPVRDRVTRPDGLVVAAPPRLLWGLAADLRPRTFERAAEDAWHRGLCDPTELAVYLEEHRCRGKAGVSTIERWIERSAEQHSPAQSGFEQDVIDALASVGLPPVVRQHPVRLRSGEFVHLDIAWPAARLAVEPDDSWFHGGDERQHRDHQRDLACAAVGWHVIRVDERFRHDLGTVARSVADTYLRRTASSPPQPIRTLRPEVR